MCSTGCPPRRAVEFTDFGTVVRLPGCPARSRRVLIAAALAVAMLVAVGLTRWRSRAAARSRPTLPLWACGADDLTARMQYTATSFAEPLQRVFDDVLRPDTDVEVTHHAESRYMAEAVTYRSRIGDAIEDRLYPPVLRRSPRPRRPARRAHTGSVHLYLPTERSGCWSCWWWPDERDVLRRRRRPDRHRHARRAAGDRRDAPGAGPAGGPGRRRGAATVARSTQTARQTTDHTAGHHGGVRGRAGGACGDDAADRRDRAARRHRVTAGCQPPTCSPSSACCSWAPSR